MPRLGSPRRIAALLALLIVLLILGTGPLSASGEAIVRSNGPRTRPVVALTFDDGISPQNCRRILAELVERGVPATFFPMAAAMPLDPALWRLIGEAGDPVGDHTLTHPEMPRLTLSQQEWQIGEGRVVAEAILGRPLLRVFRPPYGAYDSATLVAAAATGFPIALLWDVDTRDWARQRTLPEMLAAAEQGRAGSVILMHCGPNATPYLVPQVIDYYRSKGFGFVTIPQLLGLAWRPGPTSSISTATILAGLSPLPPLESGGPITGPNGYVPSPDPSPGGPAGPSPTPAATDAAGPSPPPPPTYTPAGPSPPPSSTPFATSTPAPATVGPDLGVLLGPTLLVAALIGVALVALTTALLRRQSR